MKTSKRPTTGKLFAGDRGFDPVTITMQIVALQFAYYSSLLACVGLTDLCIGLRPHLAQIFTSLPYADLSLNYGHSTLFAHWINVPFVVLCQALIVEKASKCLDFTVTILFVHFACMWLYDGGYPGWQFSFWVQQIAWATATCLLAEALCMKLET